MKKNYLIISFIFALLLSTVYGANVGDYYFKDGTISPDSRLATQANPIVGIVFEVTQNGEHGKVVSIDETSDIWSPNFENVPGAKSESDGLMNMADVLKQDNSLKTFPAFAWVHRKNGKDITYESGKKGIWYLPAVDELQALSKAAKAVNKKIKKVSGATPLQYEKGGTRDLTTQMLNNDANAPIYWSSTEYDGINHIAHYYRLGVGSIVKTRNKDDWHRVRAILAF